MRIYHVGTLTAWLRVLSGASENVINVYDTSAVDGNGYCQKKAGFSDPDPALEGAAHDGYIAGLTFIDGALRATRT